MGGLARGRAGLAFKSCPERQIRGVCNARGGARSRESSLVGELARGRAERRRTQWSKQTSLNVNGKRVGVSSVGGLLPVVCSFRGSSAPQKKGWRPRNRPTFPQDLRIPQIGTVQRTGTFFRYLQRPQQTSTAKCLLRVSSWNDWYSIWYFGFWCVFSWKPVLLHTASLLILVDRRRRFSRLLRHRQTPVDFCMLVPISQTSPLSSPPVAPRPLPWANNSSSNTTPQAAYTVAAHTLHTGSKTGALHEWLRVMEDVFVPHADEWPGPLDCLLSSGPEERRFLDGVWAEAEDQNDDLN